MGTALLWVCFDNDFSNNLPLSLVLSVQSSYSIIRKLKDGENPVEKKIVIPIRNNDSFQLVYSEIKEMDAAISLSNLGKM